MGLPCFLVNGVRAVKSKLHGVGRTSVQRQPWGAEGRQCSASPPWGWVGGEAGDELWTEDHWLGPKEKVVSITKVATGLPRVDKEDTS